MASWLKGQEDMSLSKLWEILKVREAWCAAVHGITKSWIWLSDWITTNSSCNSVLKWGVLSCQIQVRYTSSLMMFSRSPEPSYNFCHFLGILTLIVISLTGFPELPISFSSTFLSYPIPHTYTSIHLDAAVSSMPSFNFPKHYQYQVLPCSKLLPKACKAMCAYVCAMH